jgi:hypothetical protein
LTFAYIFGKQILMTLKRASNLRILGCRAVSFCSTDTTTLLQSLNPLFTFI